MTEALSASPNFTEFAIPRIERLPYTHEDDTIRRLQESTRTWALGVMPPYVEAARLNFHQHMATRGLRPEEQIPLEFPHEFMRKAAEVGLLGLDTPEEYGGQPLEPLQQAAVMEELARVDAGLALKILVQNTLTARPIARFGTEAQKQKYLRRMAEGELIGCYGLSEPDTGSDATNLKCKATKVDRGWLLRGEKTWNTSGNAAGVMIGDFRTGASDSGASGTTALLVDLDHDNPNLEINTIPKHGQHGSQFCQVTFKDYFVPDDALLGEKDKGWAVMQDTLTHSRWWIAAQGTGVAMHALDLAQKYGQDRPMYGHHLIDEELWQQIMAHNRREVDIARLLIRKAAYQEQLQEEDKSVNRYVHLWASLAKGVAGEVAAHTPQEAQHLHGALGYTMEAEIGYVENDGKVIRTYEGPREIQLKNFILKYLRRRHVDLVFPNPRDHFNTPIDEVFTPEEVMVLIEEAKLEKRAA